MVGVISRLHSLTGIVSADAVLGTYNSPPADLWRIAMARLSRFAVAAIAAIAVGLVLTYGTYAIRLLAGGPLTRRYIIWSSFLLPIFLGLFAAVWPAPKLKRSALAAGSAGAAIGLAYIYVATRLLFWVVFKRWGGFGHSIFFSPMTTNWDLDLEAFTFAIASGACAMLLAITARSRRVLLAAASIVVITGIVPGSAYNLITHNQEFTIAVVTPQGAAAPSLPDVRERVDIRRIDVANVTSQVLRSLGEAGVSGKYQVTELYRQGHGKRVLGIVVISGPVASSVKLPEPSGADVIYVQGPDGWRTIPSQVQTLDRYIEISPPSPGDNDLGSVRTQDVGGMGTIFELPRLDR
jgi:hypothetical protein